MFKKGQVAFTLYQIAKVMKLFLFRKEIHQDLNSTNILVAWERIIKIIDNGTSILMMAEKKSITKGFGMQKFMVHKNINEQEYEEKVVFYFIRVNIFIILSGGKMQKITFRGIKCDKNTLIIY